MNYYYFKLSETNRPIKDNFLILNPEKEPIPEDYYLGWGGRGFFDPIYDHEKQDWIEGLSHEEIEELTKPQPAEPTEQEILQAKVAEVEDKSLYTQMAVTELFEMLLGDTTS